MDKLFNVIRVICSDGVRYIVQDNKTKNYLCACNCIENAVTIAECLTDDATKKNYLERLVW